ncbi:MAG: hypothetical protein JXN59_12240 [Anaerolineae bacterium]|nr:hypothetical protein [Anaerolineae bacterium]
MQRFKSGWEAFKTIAILFSFIVNLVLVITLVVLVTLIFQIKGGIAEPLIDGLHASFVGLDKATIDRVIPVRETIPVQFDLPLQQNTTVVLTAPVPLQASAQFNLPGGGGTINGLVSLQLPQGMQLPVSLDLNVPVDTMLPVSLDVRALIPLEETQLHDPLENLRGLLDPFVRGLDNLPDNAQEGWAYLGQLVSGNAPDLLQPTIGSQYPWPGYSITAGDDYQWPADMPVQPGSLTGTVPEGLEEWEVAPGAPNGIYIPYGWIGPANIIPAGSDLIDPATAPRMRPEAIAPSSPAVPAPTAVAPPESAPSGADQGILPTPAP